MVPLTKHGAVFPDRVHLCHLLFWSALASWGRILLVTQSHVPVTLRCLCLSFRTTTAVILCYRHCGKEQSGRNTGKKHISHILILFSACCSTVDFCWMGCCLSNADVENEEDDLSGKQLAAVWIIPFTWRISRLFKLSVKVWLQHLVSPGLFHYKSVSYLNVN